MPIAGADRLTLSEHIAVMDLMALARVTLLPEDDLSLAALLKSPLVGLDEDALYELAVGRGGKPLWDALRDEGETEPFAGARRRIEAWRAAADLRDPHGFFARILGPDGGRRAFLARLGPEADDVLDEFLAQALAFEQVNVPTLEGFIAWLGSGDTDIKRDTETGRDEVRVMTVHGAKGLEADVVFLVDNGTRPSMAIHDRRALPLHGDGDDPDEPGPLVWMRAVKRMPARVYDRVLEERARAEEEYRRLLYVGLTRAKDRLYVVGISNRNSDKEQGWHALVTAALEPDAAEVRNAEGALEALEWRPEASVAAASAPPSSDAAEEDLPAWFEKPAPPPPAALPRVSPSTIGLAGLAEARPRAVRAAGDGDALDARRAHPPAPGGAAGDCARSARRDRRALSRIAPPPTGPRSAARPCSPRRWLWRPTRALPPPSRPAAAARWRSPGRSNGRGGRWRCPAASTGWR